MNPQPPRSRKLRILQLAGFPAAITAVACGSILGIDDALPFEADGGALDGIAPAPDAPTEQEGGIDVPAIPNAHCTLDTCASIGGTCVEGACLLRCTTKGCPIKGGQIDCPPGTDCQIACEGKDQCNALRCVAGDSCSFYCDGEACKDVSCASKSCFFECGFKSCQNSQCDSPGACVYTCRGEGSCAESLKAEAGTYCGITCSGVKSCSGGTHIVSCAASPDASIVCDAFEACKDSRPTCSPGPGATCKIACDGDGTCGADHCCQAKGGACIVTKAGENKCAN